jgi:SET domain-containing protein
MPHDGVYARIMPSKIRGVGVFAIRNIPKGAKLFEPDDGELVWMKKSALKLDELPLGIRQLYDDFCPIKDKGETYGCPRNFNSITIAWYVNHSETPNVGCDEDYTFFALRDILSGEELTADYRTYNEFADDQRI